ncbi:MAG: hypothetical protein DRG24_00660 [Epsilonproteobacteria bacterium]|nr:MAG: hypothetical protein DRG24_00660 [Campylobacterota bacterium]
MSEPTLEAIEDYNTLSGEKRKIVWAVIISGMIIGSIYAVAQSYYGTVDDAIVITETVDNIPVR